MFRNFSRGKTIDLDVSRVFTLYIVKSLTHASDKESDNLKPIFHQKPGLRRVEFASPNA